MQVTLFRHFVSSSDALARETWTIRLSFFAIGFAPIICLSFSCFELLPLYLSAPLFTFPAIVAGLLLAIFKPSCRREVGRGICVGLLAVTLYDLTRFPFVIAGTWPDFIPKIGNYLLDEEGVHWIVGYAWRYLGNGGGMGLAFYMMAPLLPRHWDQRFVGCLYGAGIFACLLATLYLSPAGTTYLFEPDALSAVMGLVGHLVFGLVLGIACGPRRRSA